MPNDSGSATTNRTEFFIAQKNLKFHIEYNIRIKKIKITLKYTLLEI